MGEVPWSVGLPTAPVGGDGMGSSGQGFPSGVAMGPSTGDPPDRVPGPGWGSMPWLTRMFLGTMPRQSWGKMGVQWHPEHSWSTPRVNIWCHLDAQVGPMRPKIAPRIDISKSRFGYIYFGVVFGPRGLQLGAPGPQPTSKFPGWVGGANAPLPVPTTIDRYA